MLIFLLLNFSLVSNFQCSSYTEQNMLFASFLQESLLCHSNKHLLFFSWITGMLVVCDKRPFLYWTTLICPHVEAHVGSYLTLGKQITFEHWKYSCILKPEFLHFFMGLHWQTNTWTRQEMRANSDCLHILVIWKIIRPCKKLKVNEVISVYWQSQAPWDINREIVKTSSSSSLKWLVMLFGALLDPSALNKKYIF